MTKSTKTSYKVRGEDLLKKVKELIHEGNIRQLVIKDDSAKVYLRIPVTIGIIGSVLLPILAVVGALAALAGVFTVEIEKKEAPKAQVKKKKP